VLGGFDELYGLAQSSGHDKNNLLVFGCWVEEIAFIKAIRENPTYPDLSKAVKKSEPNVRAAPSPTSWRLAAATDRLSRHAPADFGGSFFRVRWDCVSKR